MLVIIENAKACSLGDVVHQTQWRMKVENEPALSLLSVLKHAAKGM